MITISLAILFLFLCFIIMVFLPKYTYMIQILGIIFGIYCVMDAILNISNRSIALFIILINMFAIGFNASLLIKRWGQK